VQRTSQAGSPDGEPRNVARQPFRAFATVAAAYLFAASCPWGCSEAISRGRGADSGGLDASGSDGAGPAEPSSPDGGPDGGSGVGGGECAGAIPAGCGAGLVCERYGAVSCVDPAWAEWPMPNAAIEVEAGAPNPESYTDNGDGTVTDNVTRLVWQQRTPPENYMRAAALAYCAALRTGGRADWRLPGVMELVSIVDTGTYNPSIDSTMFPGTPAVGFYWSSTPYAGDPGSAWGVYFNNGYSDYNDMTAAYSVRCVR
jgi:hypothetical protein